MKTTTVLLSLLAIAPSALALGTCHNGQRYCGTWLLSQDGYSQADLQNAHHGPHVSPYPPPSGRFQDALYLCQRNNQLEYIEYCWEGCHETGGDGSNDFCEIIPDYVVVH